MAATKRTGHTGGPRRPGYQTPRRKEQAQLPLHRDIMRAINDDAARYGITQEEAVARRFGVTVPPAPRRGNRGPRSNKPPTLDC